MMWMTRLFIESLRLSIRQMSQSQKCQKSSETQKTAIYTSYVLEEESLFIHRIRGKTVGKLCG